MLTSCLLSMAQFLRGCERVKEEERRDGHLVVVTGPQIDHDVLVPMSLG